MIRLWHAVIALLAGFALMGQTVIGIDQDRSLVNLFSYFTIESNILVMIAAALIAIRPERGGPAFGVVRLAGLTGITVTGLVYATVLAGTASFTGIEWWYDKIFHYVVPAMAVIGFLAFKPRTRFDRSALWFIVWPVVWLGYTLIRAEVVEPTFTISKDTIAPVPYDFLDVAAHGAVAVIIACVIVTALMLGLAWAYVTFSQRDRSAVA